MENDKPKSPNKALKDTIKDSLIKQLHEVTGKLGHDSKKLSKVIDNSAKKLAKKLAKAIKKEKPVVAVKAASAPKPEKIKPVKTAKAPEAASEPVKAAPVKKAKATSKTAAKATKKA